MWITRAQKELAKSQSQISNIYFRKGNNHIQGTICVDLIWKYKITSYRVLVQYNFIIPFRNILFPYAES